MAIENGVQNAELGYILDPAFQIEGLNGKPVIGGWICIYEAGTDNKYISYENFDGAQNPFKVPLKSDGRAVILGDPSLSYDIYFYDSYGNQLFSRLNVQCNVPGNISIKGADTRIKNTDGTLDISLQTQANNVREYTVNTRNKLLDVQSPLYFVENSTTATIIGVDTSSFGGNSELTLRTNGIKDGTYDTLGTYTPQGGAKNIDIPREVYTFTIGNQSCFYNDVIMAYLNSKVVVALEIESWYEDGQQKQNVYENFAQKQFWGNNNFYNGGYVNFVRVDVEKNQIVTWKCEPETQGSITGYAKWTKTVTDLGSGGLFIAEYGNPGTTYEEIDTAFNAGKTIIAHKKDDGSTIDQYYQLCEIRKNPNQSDLDSYVFVNCYSYTVEELFRFQSNWSNLETHLATWDYVNQQISAGNFATKTELESATSGKMDVTGMTAYATTSLVSSVSAEITATIPTGDYLTKASADTLYYGNDNPSGFITGVDLSDYATTAEVAEKLDTTAFSEASGNFYTTDNPSGFITGVDLSPYQTTADMTAYATTALVSSVSSELYSAISSISGDYELVAGSGVELVDDPNAKTTTINVTAEGTPVTAIEQMIESATSGKADLSGVIEYSNKPESGAIFAGENSLANVHAIFGESDSSGLRIVPSDLLQIPDIITANNNGITASGLTAYSDSSQGGFSANGITAGPRADFTIQGQGETFSASYGSGFVFSSVNTGFGTAQLTYSQPNATVSIWSPKFEAKNISGAGFSIEGSGARGYDASGNVVWDTTKPAKLIGWNNYQGTAIDQRATGIAGSIIATVLPDQIPTSMAISSAPYSYMNGFGVYACYPGGTKLSLDTQQFSISVVSQSQSTSATMSTGDISFAKYNTDTSATDIWSLTGSVQKREIEGDSATSAITAIAGSAIGGGAEIVNHDNTLSGNGTVDSPLGVSETVLFEGTPASVTADIPLTENPANFEYVDVFAKWNYNGPQNIYCYNRIPTSAANFNMYGYGTYNNGSTTDFNLWMVVGDYTLTSNKISVLRAYRRTAAGDGGNNTDTLKIFKVIGINRKA